MFESDLMGFWITFKNGFRVSVQWGLGTYVKDRGRTGFGSGSPNAEVAVFDPDGKMTYIDGPHDTVAGWVSPEDVAALLEHVSQFNTEDRFDQNRPIMFR